MAKASPSVRLLAGGTGLIGRELSRLLLAQSPTPTLHLLVRRKPPDAHARARWSVVDFAALPKLPAAQAAFCCLGTTIKQAGSQAAFRAVDFEAVLASAKAAHAAGVKHFEVVSALGASPSSANFYSRVKGSTRRSTASSSGAATSATGSRRTQAVHVSERRCPQKNPNRSGLGFG